MKMQFLFTRLFAIAFIASVFVSCKKEDAYISIKKPFKANIDTWYRISPTEPKTVIVNGTTYVGFAYFPGGGAGKVTCMGHSTFYFNQLVYAPAVDAPPAGSIAAPLVDAVNYPVTGAPLPLIQAGDFTALAHANDHLHIPLRAHDHVVNSVFYDHDGNAIFTSAIRGSGSTFPISKTLVGFKGKGIIVGGRGKFEHAAGRFDYEGYFNTADANDAEYNADGWIAY